MSFVSCIVMMSGWVLIIHVHPYSFITPLAIHVNKYNVVVYNYIRLYTKNCWMWKQHVPFYIDIVVVIMKTNIIG